MNRGGEIKSKFQDSKITRKNQCFISQKWDIMREKRQKKNAKFRRFRFISSDVEPIFFYDGSILSVEYFFVDDGSAYEKFEEPWRSGNYLYNYTLMQLQLGVLVISWFISLYLFVYSWW